MLTPPDTIPSLPGGHIGITRLLHLVNRAYLVVPGMQTIPISSQGRHGD